MKKGVNEKAEVPLCFIEKNITISEKVNDANRLNDSAGFPVLTIEQLF